MGRHLSADEEERVRAVDAAIDFPSRWTLRFLLSGKEWVTRCGYTHEEIIGFTERTGLSITVRRHNGRWSERNKFEQERVRKKRAKQ